LGAGAAASCLPLSKDISRKWEEKFDYHMDDRYYLPKVAQFLAIDRDDDLYPKYKLADELKRIQVPDFSLPEPFPITQSGRYVLEVFASFI
jgi:hypothetical protein